MIDESDIRKAFKLIAMVGAEFESDLMSVQCFDVHVIVKPLVELATKLRNDRWPMTAISRNDMEGWVVLHAQEPWSRFTCDTLSELAAYMAKYNKHRPQSSAEGATGQ